MLEHCKCEEFKSSETEDDVCVCGHDVLDHLEQVIGSCGCKIN